MAKIPTPHIEVDKQGVIADIVFMCGDPLRAEKIAKEFLTDVYKFNSVRNMFGFTGNYKGKKISVMGHGMGFGSCGIYFYELFNFYNVKCIVRIGTCGGLKAEHEPGKVIVAEYSKTNSNVGEVFNHTKEKSIQASSDLYEYLHKNYKNDPNFIFGSLFSCDVFYAQESLTASQSAVADGVEMESYFLYLLARTFNKKAISICTVSDNLISGAWWDAASRAKNYHKMVEIAFSVLNVYDK
ncbi:purine nucleoside phosphorylase DeoD-type [Mycoplasma sp. SG1]|uniref:phosphorylase family protein n=1 Tax=Mycoplasma sp. SG1 TaxID=2810348 RepID=UPI00202424FA|nr:purine nucleoside phosphorylase DeoD-type [Mycoplasma sp. SG1]URM53157.1 purine nucleoside phosphorylase DeoD-type [Mycoplasma sp. SG1]